MTFHLMFVNIIFSSVWIDERLSFGKELLTRLNICSLCILTVILVVSHFGLKAGLRFCLLQFLVISCPFLFIY